MKTLDADAILARATPVVHHQAHEIQPFNHLVKMPIAFAQPSARVFTLADRDHNIGKLDAVAGSEFIDDRIRLRGDRLANG
jgi:hypothetical protein